MVRVAIVGIGFMGKTHLGVYNRLANATVIALCDIRPEMLDIVRLDGGGNITAASGVVDLVDVKKYGNFDEMLLAGGFEVVDICLPTYLHAEFADKALRAGYHVFCEKPMALDVVGTARIIQAVKETGKCFSVGQCLRYWPAYAEIKKLLDYGKYGNVKYAEFARYSSTPGWAWNNWLLNPLLSGCAALDLHIHDVDILLYFFGRPQGLKSVGAVASDGGIHHITTVYQYADFSASTVGGWKCTDSFGFNMRAMLILERATIEMDFSKQPLVVIYPQGGTKQELPLPEGDGYYYELQDFINGVERGHLSKVVTPESAAEAVWVCLEEIRSVKEKREFSL